MNREVEVLEEFPVGFFPVDKIQLSIDSDRMTVLKFIGIKDPRHHFDQETTLVLSLSRFEGMILTIEESIRKLLSRVAEDSCVVYMDLSNMFLAEEEHHGVLISTTMYQDMAVQGRDIFDRMMRADITGIGVEIQ